jgi:hypothetical protein
MELTTTLKILNLKFVIIENPLNVPQQRVGYHLVELVS